MTKHIYFVDPVYIRITFFVLGFPFVFGGPQAEAAALLFIAKKALNFELLSVVKFNYNAFCFNVLTAIKTTKAVQIKLAPSFFSLSENSSNEVKTFLTLHLIEIVQKNILHFIRTAS